MKPLVVESPAELDPFDGTDGNVALLQHQEETAIVRGPAAVPFWESDDQDVEEYGIVQYLNIKIVGNIKLIIS